jgi:hypothetical protein
VADLGAVPLRHHVFENLLAAGIHAQIGQQRLAQKLPGARLAADVEKQCVEILHRNTADQPRVPAGIVAHAFLKTQRREHDARLLIQRPLPLRLQTANQIDMNAYQLVGGRQWHVAGFEPDGADVPLRQQTRDSFGGDGPGHAVVTRILRFGVGNILVGIAHKADLSQVADHFVILADALVALRVDLIANLHVVLLRRRRRQWLGRSRHGGREGEDGNE